jgi:Tfp pilus assembly protein PilN
MLKGNLSTRPFYNERLVALALATVAILALLLTAYDARRLVELSHRRTAALVRLDANRREAARIRGQAQALLQAVDRPTLTRLAAATREANGLIDQRTFSWTGLLSLLEQALPLDVRLVSISPRLDKGGTRISMTVALRDLADVDTFIDNLTGTDAFHDVSPTEQQHLDDGTYTARIDATYDIRRQPPAASGPSVRENQQ